MHNKELPSTKYNAYYLTQMCKKTAFFERVPGVSSSGLRRRSEKETDFRTVTDRQKELLA